MGLCDVVCVLIWHSRMLCAACFNVEPSIRLKRALRLYWIRVGVFFSIEKYILRFSSEHETKTTQTLFILTQLESIDSILCNWVIHTHTTHAAYTGCQINDQISSHCFIIAVWYVMMMSQFDERKQIVTITKQNNHILFPLILKSILKWKQI